MLQTLHRRMKSCSEAFLCETLIAQQLDIPAVDSTSQPLESVGHRNVIFSALLCHSANTNGALGTSIVNEFLRQPTVKGPPSCLVGVRTPEVLRMSES